MDAARKFAKDPLLTRAGEIPNGEDEGDRLEMRRFDMEEVSD